MSLEPATEVWAHGLLPLPGAKISERTLLAMLEKPRPEVSADLTVDLASWRRLAADALGLSATQAAASMRLCHLLSQPGGAQRAMPTDEALRVPLGALLLLLWVQWAQHELGEGCATSTLRAQAASGEVRPSRLLPPAAAANALVVDGGAHPCARTLAVTTRLDTTRQLTKQRRKLLQSSLPALLQLAGAGAERLYATELDRLALLLKPERTAAERLASRGLRGSSISQALGLWADHQRAAIPIAQLLPALRAALVEVSPAPPPPRKLNANEPATPLQLNTSSPLASSPVTAPRPLVLTSDEEREPPSVGTLSSVGGEGGVASQGGGVLRLQGAKRRTVVLRESELQGGTLSLIDCHGCYIYALAPIRCAELLGCCGCTVVLGAVGRMLSVSYCEQLKLYATCQALRLANCIDTSLQLCVNSPPMLWGENHRLHLAPFGTVYDGLTSHMATAHVSPDLERNFWGRPITPSGPLAFAPDEPATAEEDANARMGLGRRRAPKGAEPQVALLPPSKFLPFHVPMDIPPAACKGEGVPPVCELPPAYLEGMVAHVRRLATFKDELGALPCSSEVKGEVQAAMHAGFKEWLQRTGNLRQVLDLMAQPSW